MERESEGVNKRVEHLILLISGQPEVSCCVRSGQDCLIRDTETQPGQREREEERARTNNLNLPKGEREREVPRTNNLRSKTRKERETLHLHNYYAYKQVTIQEANKCPAFLFCMHRLFFYLASQPTCGPSSIVQPVEECKIWALENHKTSLVHLVCVCCALKLKSI